MPSQIHRLFTHWSLLTAESLKVRRRTRIISQPLISMTLNCCMNRVLPILCVYPRKNTHSCLSVQEQNKQRAVKVWGERGHEMIIYSIFLKLIDCCISPSWQGKFYCKFQYYIQLPSCSCILLSLRFAQGCKWDSTNFLKLTFLKSINYD